MKQTWLAVSFGLLAMTGCSTATVNFDANNKVQQEVNGKSYLIPKGAHASPYVDKKVISFYQKLGLSNCKEGDITWEETSAADDMSVAIGNGDQSIYKKLAEENRIGCASPLVK